MDKNSTSSHLDFLLFPGISVDEAKSIQSLSKEAEAFLTTEPASDVVYVILSNNNRCADLHYDLGLEILGGCCGTNDQQKIALAEQLSTAGRVPEIRET